MFSQFWRLEVHHQGAGRVGSPWLPDSCLPTVSSHGLSSMCTFPWSFTGVSNSKESACNAGVSGLIPGSGRPPGEGNGNPLQYSCLENPMDRGAWQATVHGVTNSWTELSDYHFHFHFLQHHPQLKTLAFPNSLVAGSWILCCLQPRGISKCFI